MTDEQLLLSLSNAELRTLLALRHLADGKRMVEATMEDLEKILGATRETVRLGLRGLESKKLVETTRTKRNFGKYSVNKYYLPWQKNLAWQQEPCQENLASTYDQVVDIAINKDSYTSTPMYNYIAKQNRTNLKEVVVTPDRWRPKGEDTSGDDELGGFGLFDDEKPAVVKHKLSTDKRDPKTRGRRPQEEWTAADVAVEFSYLLSRKYPYLPGTFQTSPLRGALAKNRKQYGITAIIELEILRLFMADERNHRDAEQKPSILYKRYLSMFKTHLTEAHKNLGLPSPRDLADSDVEREEVSEFVYASDGRAFDNSIPGRRKLSLYEQKLQEQK
jgi:predicted transcriptional regulator